MLYQRSLTIPANTPATAPVSETLKLTLGTSTRREVEFPDGCVGLVGVRVKDKGWQVLPWSRDEWLISSGNVVVDESPYPITSAPFIFTITGYNTDTVNDHTVQLRVILREGEAEDLPMLDQLMAALRGY